MRDHLLQAAGCLAVLVGAAHGILGETKVFARATIDPPRLLSCCGSCGSAAPSAGWAVAC